MEASSNKDTSMEQDKTGPDYFGYYTCEVAYLLSQTEDYFDLSESNGGSISKTESTRHPKALQNKALFCNALGANISDFKKERLNALLRQSVPLLTQEVVEMEDPVIALHRIHIFKEKASTCSNAKCNDNDENPCKKSKLCSSSSMRSTNPTNCSHNVEVNDDLQLLLRTESAKVQETMKRMSDELHETLERKKQKLEELLNVIMSNCRPMTLGEKQQLRNLIWKLPPKNLNRVVDLIKLCQPSSNNSSNEIFVDLEKLDNTTLWRLYYYVQAFENARTKLSIVD